MTIDQLRDNLLLVVAVGNQIISGLSALGDSVSESELAVSGARMSLGLFIKLHY